MICPFLITSPLWSWVEFTNNSKTAGIDFLHRNGATGKRLFPEPNGAGCAFLDYNADGWMDIYLVNSGNFQNPNAPNATIAQLQMNCKKNTYVVI